MLRCSFSLFFVRLFAFCAFAIAAEGLMQDEKLTQFGRQNWQTENGLPQNTVHAILQASDGFLWLGTDGGLVRFDGLHFATYDTQNTPGLKSDNVQALAEDNAGSLWFSTPEGVSRWHDSALQTFTVTDGLPPGRSWWLECGSSGAMWAASAEGTARFSNGKFVSASFSGSEIEAFGRDRSHRLWVSTGGTLRPLESNGLSITTAQGRVRSFLVAGTKAWVGTDHGLWMFSGGRRVRQYTTRDGLPSERVTCLMQDRNGNVWVGTENGVARIAGSEVETFPPGDTLSGDVIDSLFEDREGNVWIGGDTSGLTILRQLKFITYSFRDAGAIPQIRCVFGSRDGAVWIGTDEGGLKRFKDGQFSALTTANGLSSNVILSLGEQQDGALLVGTPDGLNLVKKDSNLALMTRHALAEDFIRSVYTDNDGSLWVGTRRGLSHVSGEQVTTYTQADGLGSDTVGALQRDRRGDLWIGTLHGLSRLGSTGMHNYTMTEGLSGNIVTDLYQDAEGSLWIATQDGGLNRYRDGLFSKFAPSLGLPQTIYGITEDRDGDFWLAAKSGIFRVSRNELTERAAHGKGSLSVIAYGTSDGLRVSEGSGGGHPAVWKLNNGDLWFATAKGAAVLAGAANSLNRVPPPVAIETVSIDDFTYNPSQVKDVSPGHSRVSFEYAGLSFVAPQKVQYKYRLEGFDKDWIDAGTRRVAYYTNLPPKSYRFRVAARNNDGFWNESGASMRIRILPHFYQTWWFYFLILCAAGLAVYGFYFSRLRQVQSRFEAVLAERNRIAREIHDTLAQGFVGVSVQLELVSRFLSASTESAREHLDQARILVRSSLSEARQSIWELRSQDADKRDFAGRFSKLAQQATESGPAKVQLEVHGQYRPLKPVIEDELFRIGQEAIANAVRHSGAQQIRIELTFDSRKLRMTVADHGRGFSGDVNSQGPEGHFGLKGMRERAERIHAQLNIESNLGSGTTVSVEAPAR